MRWHEGGQAEKSSRSRAACPWGGQGRLPCAASLLGPRAPPCGVAGALSAHIVLLPGMLLWRPGAVPQPERPGGQTLAD